MSPRPRSLALPILALLLLAPRAARAQERETNYRSNDVTKVSRDPRLARAVLRAPGGPVASADAAFQGLLGSDAGLTIGQQLVLENALAAGKTPTRAVRDLAGADFAGLTSTQRDALRLRGIPTADALAQALDGGRLDESARDVGARVSELATKLQDRYTFTPDRRRFLDASYTLNGIPSGYIRANEGLEAFFQAKVQPAFVRAMEQALGFRPDTLTVLTLGREIAKGKTLEEALAGTNFDYGLPRFRLTGDQRARLNYLLQGSPGFDPTASLASPGPLPGDAQLLADQKKIADAEAAEVKGLSYGANEAGYIRSLRDAPFASKLDPDVSGGVRYEDDGLPLPNVAVRALARQAATREAASTAVAGAAAGDGVTAEIRGRAATAAQGPRMGMGTVLDERTREGSGKDRAGDR